MTSSAWTFQHLLVDIKNPFYYTFSAVKLYKLAFSFQPTVSIQGFDWGVAMSRYCHPRNISHGFLFMLYIVTRRASERAGLMVARRILHQCLFLYFCTIERDGQKVGGKTSKRTVRKIGRLVWKDAIIWNEFISHLSNLKNTTAWYFLQTSWVQKQIKTRKVVSFCLCLILQYYSIGDDLCCWAGSLEDADLHWILLWWSRSDSPSLALLGFSRMNPSHGAHSMMKRN